MVNNVWRQNAASDTGLRPYHTTTIKSPTGVAYPRADLHRYLVPVIQRQLLAIFGERGLTVK